MPGVEALHMLHAGGFCKLEKEGQGLRPLATGT
jgi:hypothetical protein